MEVLSEFKVNEYITLKLLHFYEDSPPSIHTGIFIGDKRFLTSLNIKIHDPKEIMDVHSTIDSMDELADLNEIVFRRPPEVTPEQEFWGHCSTFQVWVEHDYDTLLLPSNLSFPILKKLSKLGDIKANIVFNEEIAKRILSGYQPTMTYLLEQQYLWFLSREKLAAISANMDQQTKDWIEKN